MEKKDVVTCPSCEVENPKSRATCQVCHSALYPLKKKEVAKGKGIEEKTKVDPKTPLPSPPVTSTSLNSFINQPPKDKTSVIPSKEKSPATKEVRHRKPRRKSRVITESQYFILQGQTLLPVEITQHVKVLKKKAVKAEARMVIDLWNRNKGLLAK